MEAHYEDVKASWEDRFERRYGFWRGFVGDVVLRYLDCKAPEGGFARLRCQACGAEKLLTLSCKQRGICPSCDAKRATAFAAFLKDELLENVGHKLFTFTLPKMLRPYFMHHRELLGELARLAYETLHELMGEAVDDKDARPGVVAVPQTFGSLINPHPLCEASHNGWHKDLVHYQNPRPGPRLLCFSSVGRYGLERTSSLFYNPYRRSTRWLM